MAAFNIGQFRRTQLTNYSTPVEHELTKKLQNSEIMDFYDPMVSGSMVSTQSYYLAFEVQQREDSVQKFIVKLEHSEAVREDTQSLRTYEVPQGTGKNYFELIFNPNTSYDQIVFELRRETLDFTSYNDQGLNGRFMQVTIKNFETVTNIVDSYLKTQYNITGGLKKIGIQGPPGLLFTLNGEEMHVGRTGIYELSFDDIGVTSLGFILKDSLVTQDGKDYFTVDFQY